jgi:adenine-specific DNA-methyltransferase
VTDYRHAEKRKNIPPAGLAGQGKVKEVPKTRYFYDPHLPPVLRFDPTGKADQLPELLQIARQRALAPEEARILADALQSQQPWLEWSGKREKDWFEVDPVALHIHERISAQAILKLAQREPLQRSLFADPELNYREAIQFYQHDVDWSNRLILGDSLTVMHSLARREDLAGKVQMIYIDPPYGIKFASNFQSQVGKRDVKDKSDDLTREPEQIRAYRDTWNLGVHSYLDYLRDRFSVCKELLHKSGSIFVQISDENLHRVTLLLDEVFGNENQIAIIRFRKKTMPLGGKFLERMGDFLIWYVSDKLEAEKKYKQLFSKQDFSTDFHWQNVELVNGERISISKSLDDAGFIPPSDSRRFRLVSLWPASFDPKAVYPVNFRGKDWWPPAGQCYPTSPENMKRLVNSEQIEIEGNYLRKILYLVGAEYGKLTTDWSDTIGARDPKYVVETSSTVIERCMLMTTDPGDLVLDPTCGSGTTAYVAEQWGRRWVTIDTSRVALSLARQRLLTAKYDFYELVDSAKGPSCNFVYKTIPHITLKSIAQNQALDSIFSKWEAILAEKLASLNVALFKVTPQTRTQLASKFAEKERREGKSAVTDADRRRWLLPKSQWQDWEVPFDADSDYPEELRLALEAYRKEWRSKMNEVNAAISASAPQETLVDQPKVVNNIVRVSGPFTVEGIQPIEETLDLDSPIGGEPDELGTFSEKDSTNAEAYLEKMIRLLKGDGVRFPDNKVVKFSRLDPISNSLIHAEGEWGEPSRRVAVTFGPQYGPITAKQVEECLHIAARRGYEDLVFAGFTIDGAAQAIIQDDPNPMVQCHLAHIRPDVNMGDLLKDTPGSQLFTVFGLPRVRLEPAPHDEWVAIMEGVDIYDPVNNTIQATHADKVAAWFLDSDYDGRTFCITQAFFPDSSAWEKIAKALKSSVDPERFAAFSGTRSLPFRIGENKRVAVKVIDPRGNEAIRVLQCTI